MSNTYDYSSSIQNRETRPLTIALSMFARIRSAHPALTMFVDFHPKRADLAMDIPAQTRLSFDVALSLQNLDELHLDVSVLSFTWYPCTKLETIEEYMESVSGLLSGQFRVLEHWRGTRAVRAELQRPCGSEWKTIAGRSNLLSFPWPKKTFKILQNLLALESVSDLDRRRRDARGDP